MPEVSPWPKVRLGEICKVVRGGSPRPAGDPRFFGGSFIPWLTVAAITNVSGSKSVITDAVGFLTEQGARRSRRFQPGTVVIANSGWKCGVAKILGFECCGNDGVAALENLSRVDPRYVSYWINSQTEFLRTQAAAGNEQPNLNTSRISDLELPLPEIDEQIAIAEALSDADQQIEALEELIAKKRLIKQGAMQDLLTLRRRLPGFSGEWKPVNLARESHLKARIGWQGLTTNEYRDSGEYHLITGTEIIDGRVDWRRCVFVDKWRYDQDRNIQLRNGDVLLTKDGTIGKVAQVRALPGPAALNSGVFVIRPKSDVYDSTFLFHVLRSSVFDAFLTKLTAGSTIVHLYQKDLVTFEFHAPQIAEQRAIAEALDDMDAEIQTLEARLAKAQAVKEGMMQNLLTGRVRLV